MSPHLFIKIILIGLFFGLASCNSDNSPTPENAKVQQNTSLPRKQIKKIPFEFVHQDKSRHEINEIHSVSLSSDLHLKVEELPAGDYYTKFTTSCKTTSQQSSMEKEMIRANVSVFRIQDLLPARAFRPSPNPKHEVSCNLYAYIYVNEILSGEVRFEKAIVIEDVLSFNNWELPFTYPNLNHVIKKSDLEHNNLDIPRGTYEVLTLCENTEQFNNIRDTSLKTSHLFNPHIFENNNIELCRFVVSKNQSKINIVSPPFYIQEKAPKLQFSLESELSPTPIYDFYKNTPIATLHITNIGNAPGYIYHQPQKNVSFLLAPVYHTNIYPDHVTPFNNMKINGVWHIDSSTSLKDGQKVNGQQVYKIEPGTSLSVTFHNTRQTLDCPLIVHRDLYKTSQQVDQYTGCFDYTFAGVMTHMSQPPNIMVNSYAWSNPNTWEKLNIFIAGNSAHTNREFHLWSPYMNIQDECPSKKIVQLANKPIRPFDINACKVYER